MKKIVLLLILIIILTQTSTVAEIRSEYIGFYNGWNQNTYPSIGIASSVDGLKWGKSISPLLTSRTNLFDSRNLNGPYPITVGNYIYLYYAAYNGTKWEGIGLTIFTKDMKIISRPRKPVLSLGVQGNWDDTKVFRPIIIYDSKALDSNKRFKMIYTGGNINGINQAGLAYSPDGVIWTKYSNNPIIANGQDTWDSIWVMPDNIIKIDDIYYIVYNGYNGTDVLTGIATASTIEGDWTKYASNPVLSNRPNAIQILTQDTSSAIIHVNDSSVFEINEPCYLTSTAGTENVRVKLKPSSTTIELYESPIYTHTISGNASIKSILSKQVGPNQIEYDGFKWKIYGSSWGVISPYETTTYAEGTTLDNMQWIYEKMPTLNYDTVSSDWDSVSQENLKFITINR